MHGTIIEPTELPTRIAVSPGNALSIASQHASAMSSKASPALALGERPYPGMSMAMQRKHVDRLAICYSQQDWSIGLGWIKAITGPEPPIAPYYRGTSICAIHHTFTN